MAVIPSLIEDMQRVQRLDFIRAASNVNGVRVVLSLADNEDERHSLKQCAKRNDRGTEKKVADAKEACDESLEAIEAVENAARGLWQEAQQARECLMTCNATLVEASMLKNSKDLEPAQYTEEVMDGICQRIDFKSTDDKAIMKETKFFSFDQTSQATKSVLLKFLKTAAENGFHQNPDFKKNLAALKQRDVFCRGEDFPDLVIHNNRMTQVTAAYLVCFYLGAQVHVPEGKQFEVVKPPLGNRDPWFGESEKPLLSSIADSPGRQLPAAHFSASSAAYGHQSSLPAAQFAASSAAHGPQASSPARHYHVPYAGTSPTMSSSAAASAPSLFSPHHSSNPSQGWNLQGGAPLVFSMGTNPKKKGDRRRPPRPPTTPTAHAQQQQQQSGPPPDPLDQNMDDM